jgi:hypothetical protein
LSDAGRIGAQDATGDKRVGKVRDDPPWFRKVKHGAIEAVMSKGLVTVTQMDVIAIIHTVAEKETNVPSGPRRKVLANLVARDVGAKTEQRDRQCARSHSGFEDAHSGTNVGKRAHRRKILRIDHLGAARHGQHEILECRSRNHPPCALRAAVLAAHGAADHVVMWNDAGMAVELSARFKDDETPALA